MSKQQQINEKQLLTDAKAWFQKWYGKTPKESNVKFIKVWDKPTPAGKIPVVVFAPTEEIGKTYIRDQNAFFRTLRNFRRGYLFAAVSFVIFLFVYIYAFIQGDNETAGTATITFGILFLCDFLFCSYILITCKKPEEINPRNVDTYYSEM